MLGMGGSSNPFAGNPFDKRKAGAILGHATNMSKRRNDGGGGGNHDPDIGRPTGVDLSLSRQSITDNQNKLKQMSKSGSTGNTANDSSLYSIQDEVQTEHDGVYKIRISNFLHTQLTIAEFCTLFFAMIGLILSVFVYEFGRKAQLGDADISISNSMRTTALTYNFICTAFLLFSCYVRY